MYDFGGKLSSFYDKIPPHEIFARTILQVVVKHTGEANFRVDDTSLLVHKNFFSHELV